MSENTDEKVFYDLFNPPPREKRTELFPGMTPEEKEKVMENLEGIVQSIDWDEVNRELEERLAPYEGNSVIWCWTPWGGFWRRC